MFQFILEASLGLGLVFHDSHALKEKVGLGIGLQTSSILLLASQESVQGVAVDISNGSEECGCRKDKSQSGSERTV